MLEYPLHPEFSEVFPMVLLLLFALGFFIQMFYVWFYFSRLSFYKPGERSSTEQPVSIVVCARNEYENLRTNLPHWLDQDYPEFELIVVNDSSDDNTEELLKDYKKRYGNLKVFDLKQNLNFFKGKKFPLSLGIKSASYDIVLLTDADCTPASNQWVRRMQSGFVEGKDIVLGYGAYEKRPGFLNRFIRFDAFHVAIQYLSLALAGKAYMGVGRNLSYRKSLFFGQKGFSSHYKVHSGDDDLFVNSVATKTNTQIEISKASQTISAAKRSFSGWFNQKRRHFTTGRHYSKKSRSTLMWYGLSKVLFYSFAVVLIIMTYNLLVILAALFLYLVSLMIIFRKAAIKLDEADLSLVSPLLDLFMTFINPLIYFSTLIAKPEKWK